MGQTTAPRRKPSEKQGPKNPRAVATGRVGGKLGGPKRARLLSARRRAEIAHQGAMARWGSRKAKQAKE